MRSHRTLLACALVAVTTLTACGTPAPTTTTRETKTTTPTKTSYPLTMDNCGWPLSVERPPRRVLILNGTSVGEVESFVLLGLQKHVVANAQSYGVSEDPAMVRARVDKARAAVAGRPSKKVLIAYPGRSMMNANGLPAVMTGGIYDDVIKAAGGVNSFAGNSKDTTRMLNKEQLATAQVDLLAADPLHDQVVWEIRAPRVPLAALVGAGLSVAGVALQALVRNPLADPYVLGLSAGASLGAVLVAAVGKA